MQNLLVLGLAAVVLTGIYYVLGNNMQRDGSIESSLTPVGTHESPYAPKGTQEMKIEENAVVTTQQRPSSTVKVAQAFLVKPGYVAIHEDQDGKPGAILGVSAYLESGETTNIAVPLSRSTADGEKLWSMLHLENTNDTTFDEVKDAPVKSVSGGPLMGSFEITADDEDETEGGL